MARKGVGETSGVAQAVTTTPEEPLGEDPTQTQAQQARMGTRTVQRLGDLETMVAAHDVAINVLENGMGPQVGKLVDTQEVLEERLDGLQDDTQEAIKQLQGEIEELRATISFLVRQTHSGGGNSQQREMPQHHVKAPEPKPYNGARDAKAVENFLFDLEQYFKVTKTTDDDTKVSVATMYLSEDAKLWWRTKYDEIQKGHAKIDTWDDLKRELKAQFFPENVEFIARRKLRQLHHHNSIREYVKEFSTIMLDIPDMAKTDQLFTFLEGLRPWARQELARRNVKSLSEAKIAAERLSDYGSEENSTKAAPYRPRFQKPDFYKGKGTAGDTRWRDQPQREHPQRGPPQRDYPPRGNQQRPGPICFLCRGPHTVRECPQRQALNTIIAESVAENIANITAKKEKGKSPIVADAEDYSSEGEDTRGHNMGAMRLLNALKTQVGERDPKKGATKAAHELMFINIELNGKTTRAMVDSGATHNFIAKGEAKRLGLKLEKSSSHVKAVNSEAQEIKGVARDVPLKIGGWKGQTNLMAIPLDDYQVILGMEFLKTAKVVTMPFLDTLCLMGENNPSIVPTVRSTPGSGNQLLSALQVKKGVRRGELTMVGAMKLEGLPDGAEREPVAVTRVLNEFEDVMPPELPKALPPKRGVDHRIELEPGNKPPYRPPYRMTPPELAELRRQLKELLDGGLIRSSKAPFGAPVLFQKKKDGSLRLCVDYRALNKVTVKNRYPIPLIMDLFDQLGQARYFSKLDLRSGYWQVRIAEGDEGKTTCVTRYGAYEFLVMPFGLTNAPATFSTMMNQLFHEHLDKFVVVYLDDIVVYSRTLEEHLQHLKIIFKILRENTLFVKREKCYFAQEEIDFLGHRVGGGKIRMDNVKVRAVVEWQPPTKVTELRSFLGFVNYYRRFIAGYSRRATPLTDLLKKEKAWLWSQPCIEAFEDLKRAVVEEPVLKLPDYGQPFEVHTDASDYAIGGVLMQEGHPVAFESRKLNDTERRYPAHEKEMTAIVHCLRVWRHYLLASRFVVKTDNIALSYFQTQKKLSPKQARWQDFLAEFDMTLEYKPGRSNVVADALSRKIERVTAVRGEAGSSASQVQSNFRGKISMGLLKDTQAEALFKLIKDGKTRKFWVQDGLIFTKGTRLYVPRADGLRRDLLKECHDTLWAGHPGVHRTMALLERAFYWPKMADDVEEYVKTCLICQQDKIERQKPAGLLEPLPVPERPWESISLDFIASLPKVGEFGSILVVVDRFSKYATFMTAPSHCTASEAAKLMMQNVVKLWGVPRNVISDRDPRFLGRFWTEVFKLLGSQLYFSTSLHPQTDGQTERMNALLEQYLRHFVAANQRDWTKLLDVAQFSYNLQRSSATNKSPFEILLGRQPDTPHSLVLGYTGSSPAAYQMAKEWHQNQEITRAYLESAARKMKKWADEGRRHQEFKVGDQVLIRLHPASLAIFRCKIHKGLVRKYDGPYPIIKRVGPVAYRLQLPAWCKIHPVFHVSNLKPYHADPQNDERNIPTRPPATTKAVQREAEEILADRKVKLPNGNKEREYLVKWKGLPTSEASWEKESTLRHEEDIITAFKKGSTRASTS